MSQALFKQAEDTARQGNPSEALSLCAQILSESPDHHATWLLQCRLQRERQHLDAALASAQHALKLAPKAAESHAEAAATYYAMRNHYPAVQHYYKAHELAPQEAEYPYQMGLIMQIMAKHEEAIQCFMKALTLDRSMTRAFNRLGTVLADAGRYEEAILAFHRALKLAPDDKDVHANLASTYIQCGRIDEAVASYRRASELAPDEPEIEGRYIFASNYLPALTAGDKQALHRHWAEKHAPVDLMQKEHTNDRSPQRKLRIGYVSRNFLHHPVSAFLLPLLKKHDRSQFEIHCYAFNLRVDDVTNQIRSLCDHWLDVAKWDVEKVIEQIRADGIDILVDLSGHEYTHQMRVFARKPAPVQVSWLGYFNSTGMAAMDYFISDEVSSPSGQEAQFSEQLLRLPRTRFCYEPERYAPACSKLPARKNGYITFGCFNNLAKVNDEVIALWAEVLQAVPDSRVLLKTRAMNDEATRNDYAARFARHGIAAERLLFRPFSTKHIEVLRAYAEVDIALDPFPFTGGLTTCEGLWMGVPLVTLAGDSLVARQGASFLGCLDMQDWVAQNRADYVRIAAEKSRDLDALAETRKTLRERMKRSPLTDGAAFACNMEHALRNIWQDWCTR